MKRLTFGLSFLLAACACLLLAKVDTDYDKTADFSQIKTYSWIGAKASDQLWADRIKQDVDAQLTSKGWSKVPSGGDAAVSAIGGVQNQQQLQTYYDNFGGGWFWRGWGGDGVATTTVENVRVGTLMVDIFNARTKKLIWRATDDETLSHKSEKNEKKLEKTVEEMFKKFPPPSRG
jgi:uncharacterized protein DUF4136